MKLNGGKINAYLSIPEASRAGLLVHGPDPMRIALTRRKLVKIIIGQNGEEEMRLTRISSIDLKKDPALLFDAMKAKSFFPGPRVVFLEEASDNLTTLIKAALEDREEGDAELIITAGQLRTSSPLRKLFETHTHAYSVAIYADPPSKKEVQIAIDNIGVKNVPNNTFQALMVLSRTLDPGDFQQMLEKISLFKLSDQNPLTVEEVDLCAPLSYEAAIDEILDKVSGGLPDEVGPVMERLFSQGIQPVTICIAATRHFKTLFKVVSHPSGAAQGISKLRPPLFGLQKERLERHAKLWGVDKVKRALKSLTDVDLKLRSADQSAPPFALIERTIIRLAIMARR